MFSTLFFHISQWWYHNQIRKQRYTPTIYQTEFSQVLSYLKDTGDDYQYDKALNLQDLESTGLPKVNQRFTQYSKYSKDSTDKSSVECNSAQINTAQEEEASGRELGIPKGKRETNDMLPYPNQVGLTRELETQQLKDDMTEEDIEERNKAQRQLQELIDKRMKEDTYA